MPPVLPLSDHCLLLHGLHRFGRLQFRLAVLDHQLRLGHSFDARADLIERIFDVVASQTGQLKHLIGCVLEIEGLVTTKYGPEDK